MTLLAVTILRAFYIEWCQLDWADVDEWQKSLDEPFEWYASANDMAAAITAALPGYVLVNADTLAAALHQSHICVLMHGECVTDHARGAERAIATLRGDTDA